MQSSIVDPVPLPTNDVTNNGILDESTLTASPLNVTVLTETDLTSTDDRPYICVTRKNKRPRRGSKESVLLSDDIKDTDSQNSKDVATSQQPPSVGLVVLFRPVDVNVSIRSINPLRLSSFLENEAPSCILEVRVNSRKNLLAVETRNGFTTRLLLKLTSLCGVAVRAYEPRGMQISVGTIHFLDTELSDEALFESVKSAVPIRALRRLGTSQTVRIDFDSPCLPQHVYVGLVRHAVDAYISSPVQCRRCGVFGHVLAACHHPASCLRCGKSHLQSECGTAQPVCVNCGKDHEATSPQCSKWQEERSVCRYRSEHNVTFGEARDAVTLRSKTPNPGVTYSAVAASSRFNPKQRSPTGENRWLSNQDVEETNEQMDSYAPLVQLDPTNQNQAQPATNHHAAKIPCASIASNGSDHSKAIREERAPRPTVPKVTESFSLSSFVRMLFTVARQILSLITWPCALKALHVLNITEPLLTSFFD